MIDNFRSWAPLQTEHKYAAQRALILQVAGNGVKRLRGWKEGTAKLPHPGQAFQFRASDFFQ